MAQMVELVRTMAVEMRKPTDREQRQQDKEDEKIKRAEGERLEQARREISLKEAKKRGCPHTITHPATKVTWHSWVAQVHAPSHCKPYFVPMCTQCQTQLARIAANPAMLTEGVQLEKYPTLNLEELERWSTVAPG
jgi:hypothetical protein